MNAKRNEELQTARNVWIGKFQSQARDRSFEQQEVGYAGRTCCKILQGSLKVGVGLAAFGLTGYAIYTNAPLIQRYASQVDLSKLMSHMDRLDFIKALISQLSLKGYLKPAAATGLVLFLLKLNIHKHIASAIKYLVKFPFKHKGLVLAVALIATILVYAPQSMMSIYLIKTLGFLGNRIPPLVDGLKTVAPVAEAMDFLSRNAKVIGFLVFDFAILGFIHQMYDSCSGKKNRFTGGAY